MTIQFHSPKKNLLQGSIFYHKLNVDRMKFVPAILAFNNLKKVKLRMEYIALVEASPLSEYSV